MPLQNASRSPRVCSWRGRKPSRARIEPSTGKPLNAVFAARTRISPVTTETRTTPRGKSENTAFATWPDDGVLHVGVADRHAVAGELGRRVLGELDAGPAREAHHRQRAS